MGNDELHPQIVAIKKALDEETKEFVGCVITRQMRKQLRARVEKILRDHLAQIGCLQAVEEIEVIVKRDEEAEGKLSCSFTPKTPQAEEALHRLFSVKHMPNN